MNQKRFLALCCGLAMLLGGCTNLRQGKPNAEQSGQLVLLPENEKTEESERGFSFSEEEMQQLLTQSATALPAAVTALPQSSAQYDPALAKQALSFCAGYTKAQQAQLFEALGFTVLQQGNYEKDAADPGHTAAYTLAKGRAMCGQRQTDLLVLSIRGTNGGEWFSNIDVAPSQSEKTKFAENFLLAAQQIFAATFDLIRAQNCPVLICGHSRGGACANLLAYFLSESIGAEQVYGYTFAAAATVRGSGDEFSSANIFNCISTADLVPYVPLAAWGYRHIGTDIVLQADKAMTQKTKERIAVFEQLAPDLSSYYTVRHSLDGAGEAENGITTFSLLYAALCTRIGQADASLQGAAELDLSLISDASDFAPLVGLWQELTRQEGAGLLELAKQHMPASYDALIDGQN